MQKQSDSKSYPIDMVPEKTIHSDGLIDTSNHPAFSSYYEAQSEAPIVIERFRQLKDVLLHCYATYSTDQLNAGLNVADIGCGAGTQCILWAEGGHNVHGIDISERLIDVGQERAAKAGVAVDFKVGTAANIPFDTATMDVCLMPELLEHVPDWQKCLEECARILKPRGLLYLSTSNLFCPIQSEFSLPLYSWYPGFLKRVCVNKALTTHRHWVNYATYPAINWFTTPGLMQELEQLGFKCYDRFDIMDLSNKSKWQAWIITNIFRRQKLFKYIGYILSESTMLVAIKEQ